VWREKVKRGLSFQSHKCPESVQRLVSHSNHQPLDGVVILLVRVMRGGRMRREEGWVGVEVIVRGGGGESVEEGEPFPDQGLGDDHTIDKDEFMDGLDEGLPVLEEGWDEHVLEWV
jgi:hypothetical protein